MLERCGVEDQVRCLGGEMPLQPARMANVAEDSGARDAGIGLGHLPLDGEQGRFRAVDQGQVGAVETGRLAGQLAANAAAGAGDQHPPAPDQGGQGRGVQFNGLPRQQLFDADIAQGHQGHALMVAQVDNAGQAQHPHTLSLEAPEMVRAEPLDLAGLIQEQHGPRIAVPAAQIDQRLVQPVKAFEDADSANLLAHIAQVQANDADRGVAAVVGAGGVAQISVGQGRRADQQQRRRLGPGLGPDRGHLDQGALMDGAAKHPQAQAPGHMEDRGHGQG